MSRIDQIVEKYTSKKKEPVNEASASSGTSLINWTFWDRKPLIYVENDQVLFSNTWEFPTGSEMSTETRQRASARGYIIVDV